MENQLLKTFPTFDGIDLNAIIEGKKGTEEYSEDKKKVEETKKDDDEPEVIPVIDQSFGNLDKIVNSEEKDEDKKKSNYEEEEDIEDKKDVELSEDQKEEVITKFKEAVEFGTFIVPEDFEFDGSEEKFQEAVELTKAANFEQAEKALAESIQDPKLWDIIEHGLKGGKYANLELFNQYNQIVDNFETIDLSSEQNQRLVLEDYYKTTAPTLASSKVQKLIEEEYEDGTLEDTAKAAAKWFVDTANKEKSALSQQTKAKRDQEILESQEYSKKFNQTLNTSGLSKDKKKEILNSFAEIKAPTGETMMHWHQQLSTVQSNPEHFIELLDILNTYDPKVGFKFDKIKSESKKEVYKSAFDRFKGGTTESIIGSGSTSKKESTKTGTLRNPVDRYIIKN